MLDIGHENAIKTKVNIIRTAAGARHGLFLVWMPAAPACFVFRKHSPSCSGGSRAPSRNRENLPQVCRVRACALRKFLLNCGPGKSHQSPARWVKVPASPADTPAVSKGSNPFHRRHPTGRKGGWCGGGGGGAVTPRSWESSQATAHLQLLCAIRTVVSLWSSAAKDSCAVKGHSHP